MIRLIAIGLFCGLALKATAIQATGLELSLPVDCALGSDCFIQNYVDNDPGPGVLDYRCGAAAYNGHKGTDFRTLTTKEHVEVIAAAPGRVLATRDGMEDRLVLNEEDKGGITDRECGNGIVLDHGNGWQTQYCHLRKGSIAVKRGQLIERGQALGLIGYSGLAAFPHLHLAVRLNGNVVDPFLGAEPRKSCLAQDATQEKSLWDNSFRNPEIRIVDTGFSDVPVNTRELENHHPGPVSEHSGAIIYWARILNLEAGEQLHLKALGPGNFLLEKFFDPMQKHKAQYAVYIGKKQQRESVWPHGTYTGLIRILRDGQEIETKTIKFTIE